MSLDKNWFTEANDNGVAFSLRIKERLHQEKTQYQQIEIFDTTDFGKLMVIDGCTMVSSRDNFIYHEMMSHPALFSHPNPKQILIIGGGDCGTLKEVLKHSGVKAALQVEIDERVTRLSEKYFPELCTSNKDARAEFYFGDGIRWVKEAATGTYDLIIVDSTDPVGPAKGLFTENFYRDCFSALGEEGILVQQSESPLLHTDLIKSMRGAMTVVGFSKCHTLCFPQCIYPSGWWSATMAMKSKDSDFDWDKRAKKMSFKTSYYAADVHRGALALPPFLQNALLD